MNNIICSLFKATSEIDYTYKYSLVWFYFTVYVAFEKFQPCLSWSKGKILLFIPSSFMVLNLASQICQQIQRPHLGIRVKVKISETVKYKKRFWGKKQDGNWVKRAICPQNRTEMPRPPFYQVLVSNDYSTVHKITFRVDLWMCMRLLLGIISGET